MYVGYVHMHIFSDQFTSLGGFPLQVTETSHYIEVSLIVCTLLIFSVVAFQLL